MPVFECGRIRKEPLDESRAVADIFFFNFQLAQMRQPLVDQILEINNEGTPYKVKLLEILRSEPRKPDNSFEDGTLIQATVEIL